MIPDPFGEMNQLTANPVPNQIMVRRLQQQQIQSVGFQVPRFMTMRWIISPIMVQTSVEHLRKTER